MPVQMPNSTDTALRKLGRLDAERRALAARVRKLPPCSIRRAVLQARLEQATLNALQAEIELDTQP